MPVLAAALGELFFEALPVQERSSGDHNLLPEAPETAPEGCPQDGLVLVET